MVKAHIRLFPWKDDFLDYKKKQNSHTRERRSKNRAERMGRAKEDIGHREKLSVDTGAQSNCIRGFGIAPL